MNRLECTRAMAEEAVALTEPNSMDHWLAQDALAAHDLLALVRRLAPFAAHAQDHMSAFDDAGNQEADAVLVAAAPWLED